MEEINYSQGPLLDDSTSIDSVRSLAEDAERQRKERLMQEQLNEYMRTQEAIAAEAGEEITREQRSNLEDLFLESALAAEESQQLASQEDLSILKEDTKTETISTLEVLTRLVPDDNRDDDNVLKIVDGVPTFSETSLPTPEAEGYILIVVQDPDDSSALIWDQQPLQWNNVPSS